jgi:hypothetical protein
VIYSGYFFYLNNVLLTLCLKQGYICGMESKENPSPQTKSDLFKLSQHVINSFKSLSLSVSPLSIALKNISIAIQPISDSLKQASLSLSSIYDQNKDLFESLTSGLKYFSKQNSRLQELQFKPLIDCGLWVTPSMLPSMISTIVEKYDQGKKSVIPAIIEGFYRRNNYQNLREAVNGWASLRHYSQRMFIFRDAFEAHINGKWTLSIPTLLPHIEGISRRILSDNKWENIETKPKLKNGARNQTSRVFQNSDMEESSLDYLLTGILVEYLEKTVYSNFNPNQDEVSKIRGINRHAILHGLQINYATRLNSLRCFLALDSLSIFVK